MDKVKFQKLAEEMKNFTSDFCFAESNDVKDFTAKLIVSTATELIAAAGATPKKSEMPCNCNCAEQTKTLQEIIDDAKAQLTDNQTYAAIIFRVDDTGTR